MATALVALATTTLASATQSVTFSNIPGTYRDLMIIFSGTYDTAATAMGSTWRVNGDGGGNYNRVQMQGNGSSATSASGVNETAGYGLTGLNGTISNGIMHFLDYAQTDKHKTVLIRSNAADLNTNAYAVRWASTSAITSLTIYGPDAFGGTADNWSIGSTFSLYGVSA